MTPAEARPLGGWQGSSRCLETRNLPGRTLPFVKQALAPDGDPTGGANEGSPGWGPFGGTREQASQEVTGHQPPPRVQASPRHTSRITLPEQRLSPKPKPHSRQAPPPHDVVSPPNSTPRPQASSPVPSCHRVRAPSRLGPLQKLSSGSG